MPSPEASDNIQPRSRNKLQRPKKKHFERSFGAVLILFAIVILLCVNNYLVYKTYLDTKQKLNASAGKFEFIETDRQLQEMDRENLITEVNNLKQQNDYLHSQHEEISGRIDGILKLNYELLNKNRELVEDNLELQNSLKIAAEAGIKPQNYTRFNGLGSRSSIDRGKYVGSFVGTAYTPSSDECGNNLGITNSGHPIIPGISIAIDNKYWPFGTVFYIKGLGYAIAMDTGSGIKGKYRFDFSVFDKEFARKLGTRKWEVYLIKLGKGEIGEFQL